MQVLDDVLILLLQGEIKNARETLKKIKDKDKDLQILKRIYELYAENQYVQCQNILENFTPPIKSVAQRNKYFEITQLIKAALQIKNSNPKQAKNELSEIHSAVFFKEIIESLLKTPTLPIKAPKPSLSPRVKSQNDSQSECESFAKYYRENSDLCENSKWFVVSSKWFGQWAKKIGILDSNRFSDLPFHYISYSNSEDYIGKISNSSIIEPSEKEELDSKSKYKSFLKLGLSEYHDFVLLPEKAYLFLREIYQVEEEIPRFVAQNNSRTLKVEVYLKKLLIVYFKNSKSLKKFTFVSRFSKVQETVQLVLKDLNEKSSKLAHVRIWKINSDIFPFSKLESLHKSRNGEFVEGCTLIDMQSLIDDSYISESDYLFCDILERNSYIIQNSTQSKCKSCSETESLTDCPVCKIPICMSCLPKHKSQNKKCDSNKRKSFSFFSCFRRTSKKVNNDPMLLPVRPKNVVVNYSQSPNHSRTASQELSKRLNMKKAPQELETSTSTNTQLQNIPSLNPVGLQNLGNTCFMNSAIQCLAYCEALTKFVLSSELDKKINKSNPLGTKGKLVMAYAELLRSINCGKDRSVAPWELKKTIAAVAPQFEGYQQHDSHEFLSYLIAGLHEDLNEVKKKPYDDSDITYTNDEKTSEESWKRHLNRNQSVIVDLIYGQYKSDVCCPKCEKHSFTFDPFNSITLPIPGSSLKSFEVNCVRIGLAGELIKIDVAASTKCSILEVTKQLAIKLEKTVQEIKAFEIKFRTPFKELENEEIFVKPRDGSVHFFEVPSEAKNFCFVITGFEATFEEFPFRLIAIEADQSLQSLISLIQSSLEPVYALISDIPSAPQTKIVSFSNSFIECFVCGSLRCEKLCRIASSSRTVSEFLRKNSNLYIKVLIPRPARVSFQCKRLKEFTKIKTELVSDGISIQDCLKAFSFPEVLDEMNSWYCPNCKKHVQATKRMEIFKAPPILILHLKRFKSSGYYREKITTPIKFPKENLDISQFVKGHNTDLYDLFAVSNHYGTLTGGHYTATVYNGLKGRWYDCNDSSVTEASDVSETASYMLFYRAKSSRKMDNSI